MVRLRQGDFDRETTYSDDPVAIARAFADAGARWLHVVDLDGARDRTPRQFGIVASIIEAVGATSRWRCPGVCVRRRRSRPPWHWVPCGSCSGRHSSANGTSRRSRHAPRCRADRRIARCPGRAGRRAGLGPGADGDHVETVLIRLAAAGIETFEVTAIDRDGELQGPDLGLLRRLVELARGRIIASAGITTLDDLQDVQRLGCAGAIVGRALYEGRLDLRAAIRAVDVAGGTPGLGDQPEPG